MTSGRTETPLLDTLREVDTPEGVALALRVAGPVPRSLAWAIDGLVRGSLIYSVAGVLLQALGEAGQGLFLLVLFVGEWFYPVLFEVLWSGQTPGKRMLDLAVVHDDGTPVGWGASLLRNLARIADFLPAFYLGGLASMVLSRDFQRLGDLAAGTRVVHRDRRRPSAVVIEADPRPPAVALRPDEQRAIMDFADRQATWTPERREELADLLSPLTGARGEEGLRRLLGIARWLKGEASP